jgi:hypothetical protein
MDARAVVLSRVRSGTWQRTNRSQCKAFSFPDTGQQVGGADGADDASSALESSCAPEEMVFIYWHGCRDMGSGTWGQTEFQVNLKLGLTLPSPPLGNAPRWGGQGGEPVMTPHRVHCGDFTRDESKVPAYT